ncbi:hypothetical protein C3Y87_09715 [Carbonactinospora thermoautotrophica]|uniref:WXG100 family type VII secretion target n=1 Tax=Carbonactinospora thermoautotrophica TaxID=1469144 RepID=A0A132MMN2_9ACTN|nr:WXG100 family type VII secretion target [Carbonactinospora thermoautotrophica]KWW99108.1 hypothetical protein LI90_741 [Carbonactinospora thermoautotrophica]KWX05083.1 hypothetical protein TH66_04940 [Carbonactinospora thermoautotrophica]KWX09329.1 hypothetical protein TR74_10235 [Carbonactinospora thermoautotrophica]MCX9191687.1 hypothetical protein [Carbonactinospora thermoautotrophica]
MATGVGDFFHVRPDQLKQTGDHLRAVAEQLTKALNDAMTAVASLEGANRGWATSTAFAECAQAWEEHLRRLGETVEGAADRLGQNASKYLAVDDLVAMAFQRLLREFGS